jgi:hypothetical protein
MEADVGRIDMEIQKLERALETLENQRQQENSGLVVELETELKDKLQCNPCSF